MTICFKWRLEYTELGLFILFVFFKLFQFFFLRLYYDQEKQSSPGKSAPLGYPIPNVPPCKRTYGQHCRDWEGWTYVYFIHLKGRWLTLLEQAFGGGHPCLRHGVWQSLWSSVRVGSRDIDLDTSWLCFGSSTLFILRTGEKPGIWHVLSEFRHGHHWCCHHCYILMAPGSLCKTQMSWHVWLE